MNYADIDLDALAADLNALQKELREDAGPDDIRHLKKIEAIGRACTIFGYAKAYSPDGQ